MARSFLVIIFLHSSSYKCTHTSDKQPGKDRPLKETEASPLMAHLEPWTEREHTGGGGGDDGGLASLDFFNSHTFRKSLDPCIFLSDKGDLLLVFGPQPRPGPLSQIREFFVCMLFVCNTILITSCFAQLFTLEHVMCGMRATEYCERERPW